MIHLSYKPKSMELTHEQYWLLKYASLSAEMVDALIARRRTQTELVH